MSSLLDIVRTAASDLDAIGADIALVGGLAVGVHVLERATRDADFVVAVPDDPSAERITADLVTRGYTLQLALEQLDTKRLSTVRLVSPVDNHTMIDLLFASSGIEPEIACDAIALDIGAGAVVKVARRGHLVALKLLARGDRRPQDDQDLVALLDGIEADELERTTEGIALIERRGFARGKTSQPSSRRRWPAGDDPDV